jgi:hypothetical protein
LQGRPLPDRTDTGLAHRGRSAGPRLARVAPAGAGG